ncbi:ComF family protein [Parasphingopyxis sp.]|uniref:ComF family protein n=1 Tax=Parasphingopyxis sp. TaxID=1920299 RepID=UPI002629A436|nr:ComF family protein [Parasphingopyxis sp.]
MAAPSHLLPEMVTRIAKPVLDFALPTRCPSCGVIVDGADRFCIDCWSQLEHLDQGCHQCGVPLATPAGDGVICGACLADPPPFDTMRAAVRYGDVERTIALRLKYGGRIGLARLIAGSMQRHMDELEHAPIVPVPLHRGRLWRRGFNQSALIARALAGEDRGRLHLNALERTRATPYLRAMGAKERAKTVRGAFAVNPRHRDALDGKAVVLVDDVYTSGATASACAKALKKAGAAEVHVRCWARVCTAEEADY